MACCVQRMKQQEQLWFHAVLPQFKEMKPKHHLPHTHLFIFLEKWNEKKKMHSASELIQFAILLLSFFLFRMTTVYQIFFWRWRQTSLKPKGSPSRVQSEQLVFSQIVLEQQSCIKKSFWGWFKPIHKDNRRLSSNQLWLFGILHPELNKQVKNKDHVCPLHLSEGMSLEVTRQSGTIEGHI